MRPKAGAKSRDQDEEEEMSDEDDEIEEVARNPSRSPIKLSRSPQKGPSKPLVSSPSPSAQKGVSITMPSWVRHYLDDRRPIYSVDIQPGGFRFVTGGGDNTAKIWSLAPLLNKALEDDETHPKMLCSLDHSPFAVNITRWSPNGAFLATGSDNGHLRLWRSVPGVASTELGSVDKNYENWQVCQTLHGHHSDIQDLAWSPDSQLLASASMDTKVLVWKGSKVIAELLKHQSWVMGLAWDPVGKFLASIDHAGKLVIWTTADWTVSAIVDDCVESRALGKLGSSDLNRQTVFARMSWDVLGSLLCLPGGYGSTKQFHSPNIDRGTWTHKYHYGGHNLPTTVIRCSPVLFESRQQSSKPRRFTVVAVGSMDHNVSVFLTCQHDVFTLFKHFFEASILDMAWTADGYGLLVASHDGTVVMFRFDDGAFGDAVALSAEHVQHVIRETYGDLGSSPILENAWAYKGDQKVGAKLVLPPIVAPVAPPTISEPAKDTFLSSDQMRAMQTEIKTTTGRRKIVPVTSANLDKISGNSSSGQSAFSFAQTDLKNVSSSRIDSGSGGSGKANGSVGSSSNGGSGTGGGGSESGGGISFGTTDIFFHRVNSDETQLASATFTASSPSSSSSTTNTANSSFPTISIVPPASISSLGTTLSPITSPSTPMVTTTITTTTATAVPIATTTATTPTTLSTTKNALLPKVSVASFLSSRSKMSPLRVSASVSTTTTATSPISSLSNFAFLTPPATKTALPPPTNTTTTTTTAVSSSSLKPPDQVKKKKKKKRARQEGELDESRRKESKKTDAKEEEGSKKKHDETAPTKKSEEKKKEARNGEEKKKEKLKEKKQEISSAIKPVPKVDVVPPPPSWVLEPAPLRNHFSCLIDSVRHPGLAVSTELKPSATVVSLIRNGTTQWEDTIVRAQVVLVSATPHFVACATAEDEEEELLPSSSPLSFLSSNEPTPPSSSQLPSKLGKCGRLYVYSIEGRRILPCLALSSLPSRLCCADHHLMVLTSEGNVKVWDLRKQRLTLSTSVCSLVSPSIKLLAASLSPSAEPLIVLSNKFIYQYFTSLETWGRVQDDRFVGSPFNSLTDSGPSIVQLAMSPPAPLSLSIAHLETKMACARLCGSGADFQSSTKQYVSKLVDLAGGTSWPEARLREVVDELAGPLHRSADRDPDWDHFESGCSKRELLRSLMPLLDSSPSLQRLAAYVHECFSRPQFAS